MLESHYMCSRKRMMRVHLCLNIRVTCQWLRELFQLLKEKNQPWFIVLVQSWLVISYLSYVGFSTREGRVFKYRARKQPERLPKICLIFFSLKNVLNSKGRSNWEYACRGCCQSFTFSIISRYVWGLLSLFSCFWTFLISALLRNRKAERKSSLSQLLFWWRISCLWSPELECEVKFSHRYTDQGWLVYSTTPIGIIRIIKITFIIFLDH